MSDVFEDILQRVRMVLGEPKELIQLHAPFLNGNEKKYVNQTIDENWVSTAGAFVPIFEEALAAYCGVAHAVAVVNGTAALHASLYALGIKAGDEVLVPAATFVASGNAIVHAGAIPHFIDCEEKTLGADPERLGSYLKDIGNLTKDGLVNKNTGRIIRALMPVHIFGVPAEIDRLCDIAEEYGLIVVQDATEALGSTYKNRSLFRYGSCAAMSFNGNKIITSGGGGAILTDNPVLAKKLKHITTTAKQPHAYLFNHDEVGYNYRMPNINAALAYAQLEQMDGFLKRKKNLAEKYKNAFTGFAHGTFMTTDESRTSNNWLNTVKLKNNNLESLLKGIAYLNDNKIQARPLWTPLHQLAMYTSNPRMGDLSVTERMAASIINLPSSAFLSA